MDSPDTIDAPSDLRLGDEFPRRSQAEWRAAVDKVLARSGKELTPDQLAERFERDLVTHTVDGLVIQPLYTDLGDAPRPGVAGAAPFTRGSTPLAHRRDGWGVRQRVVASGDTARVAEQVLEELERGSTSVLLDLAATGDVEVDVDYLDAALHDVLMDLAPIALWNAPAPVAAAQALLELLARRGVASNEASGSLGLDPIGRWATSAAGDIDDDLARTTEVAVRCADETPGVMSIAVDATVVHEAGGGDVEELAYAAAAGLSYVRALVGAGVSIDDALGQLEFRFAATPDQFLTIAKFRAARRMWQRIAEVCGAASAAQVQCQHAISSTAASSRYDIWVNLLRGTVECFGAGVGGADAVTIHPHDELLVPGGSELGRRMARNTQLVLIEESNLAKVVDIAGGSWYVEQLTDQLADAAWSFMQDIETAGGLIDAVRGGVLQERIDATRERRDTAVATRSKPMTGVTEFPNIADETPPSPAPDDAESDTGTGTGDLPFAPLVRRRYADPVEAQRRRADELASSPAGRPTIFLAPLGTTASSAARVSFAKNLFEIGGIEAIVGDSSTEPAAVRRAYEASGASLVCICASDPVYADLAVATAEELHAAQPARLYVAGRPRGMDDDLAAAGVDEQIAAGGDVVAILRTALDTIGAPS